MTAATVAQAFRLAKAARGMTTTYNAELAELAESLGQEILRVLRVLR